MKKRLALMLAVIMAVLSIGMVSYAKGNVTELDWSDGEKAVKEEGIKGKFVTLDEINLKFWLPNDYKEDKLTDDEKKAGLIACYFNSKTKSSVSVIYVDVEGATLEDYKDELEDDKDVTELEDCVINGIECIGYRTPKDESLSVSFVTEKGYILEFYFTPVTDDDDTIQIPAYIMSSIMEAE